MLLHNVLELAVRRKPTSPALIWEGVPHSFLHFRERVSRAAAWLSTMVPPGSRVAILSENCPEVIEATYAVPMAGSILVLVNYRLHPKEIEQVLADSGARVLIHNTAFRERAAALDAPSLEHRVEFGSG